MISTSDFAKGVRFLVDNEPYVILEVMVQTGSGRGSGGSVKVKARNLLTGRFLAETFKPGTKFEQPDIRQSNVQYLYNDGADAVFMDQESFEQFNLPLEALDEQAVYLREDLKIKALYFNNKAVSVEIPLHVEVTVDSVEPGTRGNTASGTVTTKATLDNGHAVQVPLNIKAGDKIIVNTNDHTFYQRAH